MIDVKRVNWVTTLYLIISPFVAAASLYYWLKSGSFNWATIVLALVLLTFIQEVVFICSILILFIYFEI
jgi:hypothetical protein